jgi:HSP20 family molecular chaperone IbpA
VKADFNNGLLIVNAPIAEAQQPRKVEIQAA